MEDVLAAYVIRMAFIVLGLSVEEGFREEHDDTVTTDLSTVASQVVKRLTCLSGVPSKDKVLQHTQVQCEYLHT